MLPNTGSVVEDTTVAVLVMVVPLAPDTATTRVKTAEAPGLSVATEHDSVPLAPTAGAVQVNGVPDCDRETNVVPAGNGSVRVTLLAVAGPLFVTVMV